MNTNGVHKTLPPLTERQAEILRIYRRLFDEAGKPPTYDQVRALTRNGEGIAYGTLSTHVMRIRAKGYTIRFEGLNERFGRTPMSVCRACDVRVEVLKKCQSFLRSIRTLGLSDSTRRDMLCEEIAATIGG